MDIQGKRVLVTGADGFIGSHLTEALAARGARVRALSQYNSFNYWGWLEDVPCLPEIEVVTGDVRDAHFCHELCRDMEVVFHLAALIPIPYSYKAPDSYVDTNVKGTLYMVQAARQHGVRKFIQTSTSEVYGSARYVPIDEDHPVTPQSPYSASKIASDAMAMSFYYAFNTPVTIARPFNTYGPRQSARAVIPTIISQVASGQTEIQLGDLTTTRDFTFALDTAQGFIAIAEMEGGAGETYQIGTNNEISVGALVELIGRLMKRPVRAVLDPQRIRPEKSEVLRLNCNNAKLKAATGYAPATSIEDGLARTIEWFRNPENLKKYKSHLYNV